METPRVKGIESKAVREEVAARLEKEKDVEAMTESQEEAVDLQKQHEEELEKRSAVKKLWEGFTGNAKIQFLDEAGKRKDVWAAKGFITKPTTEEWNDILRKAEADKWEGVLAFDKENKKAVYKHEKNVKWAGGGGGGLLGPYGKN